MAVMTGSGDVPACVLLSPQDPQNPAAGVTAGDRSKFLRFLVFSNRIARDSDAEPWRVAPTRRPAFFRPPGLREIVDSSVVGSLRFAMKVSGRLTLLSRTRRGSAAGGVGPTRP